MGVMDDELKRLKKYAEGLGIKVFFRKYKRGVGGAEWNMLDRSITIFTKRGESVTGVILTFLHELGHHMDWIYSDKTDSEEAMEAYTALNEGKMIGARPDLSLEHRRIILEEELAGIHYMEFIAKELDLKIPFWKVKMQQELDSFEYRLLYEESRFSTTKEYRAYKREIKEKYKKEYGVGRKRDKA